MGDYIERLGVLNTVGWGSDGDVALPVARHCSAAHCDPQIDTSTPEMRRHVLEEAIEYCSTYGQSISEADMAHFDAWVAGEMDDTTLAATMAIDHMDPKHRNP